MVICSGSIAYDYILNFKGRFREHILPDKTHILNLSFLVDNLHKRRGGVAGNYSYNLWLLGYPAAVLATAGGDAAEYRAWLQARGIDCRGLHLIEDEITATGFTTTDMDDNQITGYYGGAMRKAATLGLDDGPPEPAAVIIGPNDPAAMMRLAAECRERGIAYVFDPAHQLPHLDAKDLTTAATGAWILIGNDYEISLIKERMQCEDEALLDCAEMVVTTLGRLGSRIASRGGVETIPAAPAQQEADPTGAGDAYRAGLVAGLLRGHDLATAGRVAALTATYAIEQVGTIEHSYTHEDFATRFRESFASDLPTGFFD